MLHLHIERGMFLGSIIRHSLGIITDKKRQPEECGRHDANTAAYGALHERRQPGRRGRIGLEPQPKQQQTTRQQHATKSTTTDTAETKEVRTQTTEDEIGGGVRSAAEIAAGGVRRGDEE